MNRAKIASNPSEMMNRTKIGAITLASWILFGVLLSGGEREAGNRTPDGPMTNDDIMELVESGLGERTIVRLIERNEGNYDLSARGVRNLATAGVSDSVIQAMFEAEDKDREGVEAPEATPRQDPSAADRGVEASRDPGERSRYFNIGAGARALTVANDISGVDDEHFNGGEFFFTASFPQVEKWLGLSGNVYHLTHSDGEFDDLDVTGFELEAKAGHNIATRGFKGYGLLGFYAEEWENGDSETFSGAHIGGGLGWNWEWVSLDFQLRVRGSRDYEDFYEDAFSDSDPRAVGVTGNVRVGVRF